jgi:hypothetical protein
MNVEMNAYILETSSSLLKAMGKEGERKRNCSCEKAYNNNYKKQQSERAMVER